MEKNFRGESEWERKERTRTMMKKGSGSEGGMRQLQWEVVRKNLKKRNKISALVDVILLTVLT